MKCAENAKSKTTGNTHRTTTTHQHPACGPGCVCVCACGEFSGGFGGYTHIFVWGFVFALLWWSSRSIAHPSVYLFVCEFDWFIICSSFVAGQAICARCSQRRPGGVLLAFGGGGLRRGRPSALFDGFRFYMQKGITARNTHQHSVDVGIVWILLWLFCCCFCCWCVCIRLFVRPDPSCDDLNGK